MLGRHRTNFYNSIANEGIRVPPTLVTSYIENNERIPLNIKAKQTSPICSIETINQAKDLLRSVVIDGTADILADLPIAVSGKTGTTQNQSDGWFMGMVPNLVTGVWVGAEDRATHFETIAYGQGATMALPIWGQFMREVYLRPELGISSDDFIEPETLTIPLDCDKYIQEQTEENLEDLDEFGFL